MNGKRSLFLAWVLTAAVGVSACANSAGGAGAAETAAAETTAAETSAAETTAAKTPAAETSAAKTPAAETTAAKTPAAETSAAETSPAETAAEETAAETASGGGTSEKAVPAEETGEELSLEEWLEEDKKRAYYDVLEGKTMNLLGDSYFSGHDMDPSQAWPELLAAKYGMSCTNHGVNGSSVSNYVTTNNPMVDRYDELPDNDPDIVLVDGGRNDFLLDVPIGEDGSTDTATMKGALRTLLEGLRQKYPAARIICVTVWEVGGYKTNHLGLVCSDYGNAMLQVCENMGIACINAMDTEDIGVDMTDMKFRNEYCENYRDVSHLNLDGMKLVLPRFEEHIAEICSEE